MNNTTKKPIRTGVHAGTFHIGEGVILDGKRASRDVFVIADIFVGAENGQSMARVRLVNETVKK